MKLDDILKKQKKKGEALPRLKASTLSIEDYTKDINAPRPYNDTVLADVSQKKNKATVPQQERKKRKQKDELNYEDLTGNAKLIVDDVIKRCLISSSLTTRFIEKREFCERLGLKTGSLKTTCVRLKQKRVFIQFETTKGRGSQWKFTLSEKVLQQFKALAN